LSEGQTKQSNQAAIEHRFTYHPPKDDQPERYEAIRDKSKELATLINSL
jgi:hypothetical protein